MLQYISWQFCNTANNEQHRLWHPSLIGPMTFNSSPFIGPESWSVTKLRLVQCPHRIIDSLDGPMEHDICLLIRQSNELEISSSHWKSNAFRKSASRISTDINCYWPTQTTCPLCYLVYTMMPSPVNHIIILNSTLQCWGRHMTMVANMTVCLNWQPPVILQRTQRMVGVSLSQTIRMSAPSNLHIQCNLMWWHRPIMTISWPHPMTNSKCRPEKIP